MANLPAKILKPNYLLLHSFRGRPSIGINYGTLSDNLPPPAQVADFIKTQTIVDRVKNFYANPNIISPFADTGILLTISTVNSDIPALTQLEFARQWVAINVASYYPRTKIIRVLVGNEIIHSGDKHLIVNLVLARSKKPAFLMRSSSPDLDKFRSRSRTPSESSVH